MGNAYRIVGFWAAALWLGLAAALAFAQDAYPTKPLRMIAPFPPGGTTDVLSRILAQKLGDSLGRQVVVENRPGAGSNLGHELAAKTAPDGYTLLMSSNVALATNRHLYKRLGFDPDNDFAPISVVATAGPVLVVHPAVPARSVKELVALARARPGELNFGSSGVGSSSHLMGELFNMMAEVKMSHVPYKGSADAATATAAGQIEISFPSIASVGPFLDARKLRALAVTSARRNPLLPSLPTVSESGLPGYDRSTWFGVAAPAGVPKEIIARLNAEIGKIVGTPKIKALFNKQGLEPSPNTPEEFAAFIREQLATNAKVVAFSKAKSE